jgi:rhodanese-related sulfurtransferase
MRAGPDGLRSLQVERLIEFIGNHPFLVSLFLAILLFLVWDVFFRSLSALPQLSAAEATLMLNREHAVLLDVRPAEQFAAGHILHAVNIPEAELAGRQKELEKYRGRPVIAYAEAGPPSVRAAAAIRASGIERIYCVRGGITAWRGAGLPVTKGKSA